MKKSFPFAILMLVILIFWGCSNGKEHSTNKTNWKPTEHNLTNNFVDISMIVEEKSISKKGLIVKFENNSDKLGLYSEDFLLEKKISGNWYVVPAIIKEYGFNDIGYELAPSEVKEINVNWDWLYGSLKNGEYRIIKSMLDFRDTGDFDEYYLAAQFVIN